MKSMRWSAMSKWPAGSLRSAAWAGTLLIGMALAGCGGGGDSGSSVLSVGVVAGNTVYSPSFPGQVIDVAARVGQSVQFDANESVIWNFSVNGSPLFVSGSIVDLGGVTITQTQISPSRVVLQSAFDGGPAVLPISVLLTATATIDAAQVATVRVTLQ